MLHFDFVLPFLKREWETAGGIVDDRRPSKEEQAMVLLIRHPDWCDEQLRQAVKTTEKQMKRWSTFNYARGTQNRQSRN